MNKNNYMTFIVLGILLFLAGPTIIAFVFNEINVWLGFGFFIVFLYILNLYIKELLSQNKTNNKNQ